MNLNTAPQDTINACFLDLAIANLDDDIASLRARIADRWIAVEQRIDSAPREAARHLQVHDHLERRLQMTERTRKILDVERITIPLHDGRYSGDTSPHERDAGTLTSAPGRRGTVMAETTDARQYTTWEQMFGKPLRESANLDPNDELDFTPDQHRRMTDDAAQEIVARANAVLAQYPGVRMDAQGAITGPDQAPAGWDAAAAQEAIAGIDVTDEVLDRHPTASPRED